MKYQHCRTGQDAGLLLLLLLGCLPQAVSADVAVIDKIYHPYVQPLEKEIELRGSIENDNDNNAREQQLYHLGYGQSLSDNWLMEGYLIGQQDQDNSLQLQAFELEALWQMTEQGEYPADWGMLFSLEKQRTDDIAEFSTALLVEKEWGRWSTTANLYVIYEFGDDIDNELETALNAQLRYRYKRLFEPALEFYTGQNTTGLGPVVTGTFQLGSGRRLNWEGGAIFGLDSTTADQTYRFLLEYEF